MKKVLTIIGARPQFIKCSPVSNQLKGNFIEVLVHTGQHYDDNMSSAFFSELNIPNPTYNLNINGGTHSDMTARMMIKLEKVIDKEKPDFIIIYGDTNSTLAGALVSVKKSIPLVHIEAGLRSHNKNMPEEINRVIADYSAELLFCPTIEAVKNLKNEGITKNVFLTGDVMKDSIMENLYNINEKKLLEKFIPQKNIKYYFVTIHRQENTNDSNKFKEVIGIINSIKDTVVFPVHPRTKIMLGKLKLKLNNNIRIIPPVSYTESLIFQKNAFIVVTDSGGIQKESYILNANCITLRDETEWTETINDGYNKLAGTDLRRFKKAVKEFNCVKERKNLSRLRYGKGDASVKIVNELKKYFG